MQHISEEAESPPPAAVPRYLHDTEALAALAILAPRPAPPKPPMREPAPAGAAQPARSYPVRLYPVPSKSKPPSQAPVVAAFSLTAVLGACAAYAAYTVNADDARIRHRVATLESKHRLGTIDHDLVFGDTNHGGLKAE